MHYTISDVIKNMNTNHKQPESRIPVLSPAPLRRSGSLRLGTCPPIQEHRTGKENSFTPKLNRHRSLQSLNTASSFGFEQEDDTESVKSFSSTTSVCSNMSQCDHAHFGRNGTTYSGRCKRYVVHCSPHSTETDDYLTPTQRTNRTIRRLRNLLKDAQGDLQEKDNEILRLKKEVVELRLLKVDSSPDSESNDVDGTARLKKQNQTPQLDSVTTCNPLTSSPHWQQCTSPPPAHSLSDSGHFEDLNSSKENNMTHNVFKTLESQKRQHEDELRQLKEMHNDKVESLLQRITDVNDRYYSLKPVYEDCKEKLDKLEKQKELHHSVHPDLITKLSELETLNEQLLKENQSFVVQIKELKEINRPEIELNILNHDDLKLENTKLKCKVDEVMEILNNMKEEKVKNGSKYNCSATDEGSPTEESLQDSISNHSELKHIDCLQKHKCIYKIENVQLKAQIEANNDRIQQLEDRESGDKDLYVQLFNKGVQAAKLLDQEGQKKEEENDITLIPDLLQKLKIKQEELDTVKSMYRRLLASRKEQPRHDPEMTLQFLKSAFYYFLTDKENVQGHLSAIESILGFTDTEKNNIEKAFLWR